MSGLSDEVRETCPGCQAAYPTLTADDCWHSPDYWPVAQAFGRAVHGDDATPEQCGWFMDDAEQIGSDLWHYLGREAPLTARTLGFLDRNPDLWAYLFNERLVVTILGTSDGSGETITEVVADLADALAPLIHQAEARGAAAVLLDGSRDETVGAGGESAEEPTDLQVRDFAALAYLFVTCEALGIEPDEEWDEFMFTRAIHRRIRAALTQDEQP